MAMKAFRGRMQSPNDLHEELERLREREGLKTDLIRIAAHGLRNPLGLVMGFAELLASDTDNLNAEQVAFLNGIQSASARMQRIVETVLSLERLEEFDDGRVRQPVDMAALLHDVVQDASLEAERRQIALELDLSEAVVMGDGVQIFEAVANVVTNAVRYTPDGGRVRVSVAPVAGYAEVIVEDTGIGIPADQQTRIFEPFFRAVGADESSSEGVGLGLYLVKRVIERHAGTISVDSTLDEGSTFTMRLPLSG